MRFSGLICAGVPLQLPLISRNCSPNLPRYLIQNEIKHMPKWEMQDLENGYALVNLERQG